MRGIKEEEEKCLFILQNRVNKLDSGILDTNKI